MNLDKKKFRHHLSLPPRSVGEEPLVVDFFSPSSDKGIDAPLATLDRFAIYLEEPKYRIDYEVGRNRDIEFPLKPGETPFVTIDEQRSLCYQGTGFFLERYFSKEEREKDRAAFCRLFSEDKTETPQLQVPEIKAVFDYKDAFYAILLAWKKTLGPTKGPLFKGMVVNPQEFFLP